MEDKIIKLVISLPKTEFEGVDPGERVRLHKEWAITRVLGEVERVLKAGLVWEERESTHTQVFESRFVMMSLEAYDDLKNKVKVAQVSARESQWAMGTKFKKLAVREANEALREKLKIGMRLVRTGKTTVQFTNGKSYRVVGVQAKGMIGYCKLDGEIRQSVLIENLGGWELETDKDN